MKKIISILTIVAIIYSCCSCKKNSDNNLSDNININSQNYNSIAYNENKDDISLKTVASSETYLNFKQGCMFKDEFYTLAESQINKSETFFTDYIIAEGNSIKSNDIMGSYEYIYNIYYMDGKYYTIEADQTNSYICKYDALTMNLEKTSILFENNPNSENNPNFESKTIYKYDFSDFMYINCGEYKIKFDSELTVEYIEHTNSFSELIDSNNNSYVLDYNKENTTLKLLKYDKNNTLIYESTDFEDLSAICTSNTFKIFIHKNKLFIACPSENSENPLFYINQVNMDTGMTEERYEIENAEFIEEGTGKYEFTYSSKSSIYGFNISTGSSDLLFTGDSENTDFVFIDNWQYDNGELHIKKQNIDLSYSYNLLRVSDSGTISKSLNLEFPRNPIINQYLLYSDNKNMYLSTILFNEEDKISGVSVDYSDDGENFNTLTDVSFENTIDQINALYIDNQKNVFILCFSEEKDEYVMYKYNSNGEKIKENTFDFNVFFSFNIYNDELYILYSNKSMVSQYALIDKQSLQLIEQKDISNNNFEFFSNASNSCNCYYYDNNSNSVCSLSLENGSITEEIDLNNYNIYFVTGFSMFTNGTFIIPTSDKLYISYITNNNNIQTINIAGLGTDAKLSELINNFNAENNGYRISFTDYGKYSYNDEDSYFSGYEKLDEEILSNNIPDIIITNPLFNMQKYQDKNLFTDLYPLMKNDTDFNEDDYFTNIIDTFTYDDKLLQMPYRLFVTTLLGTNNTSQHNDNYMDYKEFIDFININPDSIYISSNDALPEIFLSSYINEFVDIKNSKCDFKNDTFYNTLKMLKSNFKSQQQYDKDCSSPDEHIMYPETALLQTVCDSIDYKELYFFGIPSFKEAACLINGFDGFAITESCTNKDIAWDFIKQLISDDYQNDMEDNIPVKKSALEHSITERTYCNSRKITFDELAAENPQIEKMISLFDKPFILSQSDSQIYKLIENELQAFYNEKKSAEETAENIQNLITRYLCE